MKLNLLERLVIQKILPKEGDFVTLKVLNSLKLTLAPSEEELKEFEVKTTNELSIEDLAKNYLESPQEDLELIKHLVKFGVTVLSSIDPSQNRIVWNSKGSEEREISIGEKATDIIVSALKELDKNKKLTQEHYTIYEKFVV